MLISTENVYLYFVAVKLYSNTYIMLYGINVLMLMYFNTSGRDLTILITLNNC